ncbi:hypothetical protein BLSTO_05702 [Blastocystis sp. subtype 1]
MEKEIAESLARLRQIGEQVGLASSSSSAHESESENPADFSERIIFSDIQQLKDMIARRDKESLICTNRRAVIELNTAIYRKLKEVLGLFSTLQTAFEKDTQRRRGRKKGQGEEIKRREEALTVMFAQLKRLEAMASENHATERRKCVAPLF